jgi:hypothetical protein
VGQRDEADEYERKYMGEGGIAYQSKAKAPGTFHAIFSLPVLLSAVILTITAALSPGAPPWLPALSLLQVAVMLPIWLLFAVLRATVTSTHVHIQYGVFGPKIPLENVIRCESATYDWKKYGGWGIRRGTDGSWAYNMMGDQGRAVRIVWRDDRGKETTTLVSARDPDAFVRAVTEMKAKRSAPKVRIRDTASAATSTDVAEAEREVESMLEAEQAEQAEQAEAAQAERAPATEKPKS